MFFIPMTKASKPTEKSEKQRIKHTNASKKIRFQNDCGSTKNGNWIDDSHTTGVVKPVYVIPTFPLTAKAVLLKGHIFKNL